MHTYMHSVHTYMRIVHTYMRIVVVRMPAAYTCAYIGSCACIACAICTIVARIGNIRIQYSVMTYTVYAKVRIEDIICV